MQKIRVGLWEFVCYFKSNQNLSERFQQNDRICFIFWKVILVVVQRIDCRGQRRQEVGEKVDVGFEVGDDGIRMEELREKWVQEICFIFCERYFRGLVVLSFFFRVLDRFVAFGDFLFLDIVILSVIVVFFLILVLRFRFFVVSFIFSFFYFFRSYFVLFMFCWFRFFIYQFCLFFWL